MKNLKKLKKIHPRTKATNKALLAWFNAKFWDHTNRNNMQFTLREKKYEHQNIRCDKRMYYDSMKHGTYRIYFQSGKKILPKQIRKV